MWLRSAITSAAEMVKSMIGVARVAASSAAAATKAESGTFLARSEARSSLSLKRRCTAT